MDLESLIKYLIWIILFAVALAGIYLLLRKLGALG
jgi:hypothetical protein